MAFTHGDMYSMQQHAYDVHTLGIHRVCSTPAAPKLCLPKSSPGLLGTAPSLESLLTKVADSGFVNSWHSMLACMLYVKVKA